MSAGRDALLTHIATIVGSEVLVRSTFATGRSQLRHGALALIAISIATGCSKQQPVDSVPAQPLVTPNAATSNEQRTEVITSSIAAAGIPTTYRANFTSDQLESIDETRSPGSSATGRYEFRGARLLKYSGAALRGTAKIDIELSLQGALISARADSGEVSAEEISAIRSRAQLLRSHALAQRFVHSHQTR